jgi:putative Ca2+/H+ antiporter (TMEM165/GDT1 family)
VTVDWQAFFTTFLVILPSELPDKSFIATLVLATRYQRGWVWLGVSLAFAVQTTIAVVAGGLIGLLPQAAVLGAATALFAAGAIILFRGGLRSRTAAKSEADAEADEVRERTHTVTRSWQAAGVAFMVIFVAEWGDLTQLLTAGLVARTGDPISVGLGAWLALITISAAAVLVGGWLQSRVPLWRVRLISGFVLTGLAIWSGWELLTLSLDI